VLVCWGLTGGPAGVLGMLLWARLQGVPFSGYLTYAASWGMATALLSALLALAATRTIPAAAGRAGEGPATAEGQSTAEGQATAKGEATAEGPATAKGQATAEGQATAAKQAAAGKPAAGAVKGGRVFRPRAWVLPCLVAGWSVVWSLLLRDQPLLAWLPLSLGYFDQIAVVLAAVAAGSLEGVLRRRLPVEGRPGRAFVLAWIALSAAPVVYAAVVAIDRGMRELLLAAPLDPAWAAEYARDLAAALVAEPAQVAVPPVLLALAATGLQRLLPGRERPPPEPDPVRPDRRWSLLVAGAALALTYFCVAVTSRFTSLTRRLLDEDAPVPLRALAFLAPPDPALDRTVVVWLWAVVAAFAVSAAVLVYFAVRGQLVRLFPASSYLVLVAALALAAALAWNAGAVAGHALTGDRLLGIVPAEEAAWFTAFAVPVFGALLFIAHSQAGVTRFARILELEGEETWEKAVERYRAWKEQVREQVPGRRARGLLAARAGGAALVLVVVAGAIRGLWGPAQQAGDLLLALPALAVTQGAMENLSGALYVVLLAGLVYLGLMKVNLEERRASAWLTVWGLSVVAGGLATLGPQGLQMGFLAGPFVVAGLVVTVRRKVLLYGAGVLVLVAAAPLVRGTPAREPVVLRTAAWHEVRPRLVIDVSYPQAEGGGAAHVNAALIDPIRTAVDGTLRGLRAQPESSALVRSTYVVVRNDAAMISVRYSISKGAGQETGRAVNYDLAGRRALTVRELFVPAAFTLEGRRRMAGAVRPYMPKGQNPRTVTVDNERLLVNRGAQTVELTFGRGYFCTGCAPFTVRVPAERLAGLLRS
jgi:hypothetical protein